MSTVLPHDSKAVVVVKDGALPFLKRGGRDAQESFQGGWSIPPGQKHCKAISGQLCSNFLNALQGCFGTLDVHNTKLVWIIPFPNRVTNEIQGTKRIVEIG